MSAFVNARWRRPFLTIAVVLTTSLAIQVFQKVLEAIEVFHAGHPELAFALPVAWIGFWLSCRPRVWRDFESTDQVLREVARPHRRIGPWLAPLIAVRTWWSHLFGASVGREGTALQMAGSFADLGAGLARIDENDRRALLRVALAAGLAAAYRTPWAGFVFALELGGELSWRTRLEALLASGLAFATAVWLFSHPALELPQINFDPAMVADPRFWAACAGLVLFAPVYKMLFLLLNRPLAHRTLVVRWFIGGLAGLALLLLWANEPLRNTGGILIDRAMSENLDDWVFLKKSFLTALFCATGWFGGDFTPNMAAGASAGNALAGLTGFSLPALTAAIGIFLPVAFTHRILATGWVMTLEYFGWRVALAAAPCFGLAWLLEKFFERQIFPRLR